MALINWLFKAQSEADMSLILGERKIELKASKSQMSPMDYYSVGYCYIPQPVPMGLLQTSTRRRLIF